MRKTVFNGLFASLVCYLLCFIDLLVPFDQSNVILVIPVTTG